MQGFNMGRYVPPDLEGTTSFNAASGKGHALGARASKLKSQGILVVRFECPFAIWCTNCQPEQIIGQGVRFNAEKKKVGNYYSTPVWNFRFKHTICGKWIEVRTDPKNAEYVVTDGGRRRDTGDDKSLDGEIRIGGSFEDRAALEKEGGFGSLEKKVEDKRDADTQKVRINELMSKSEKDWADPYEMNRKVRRDFRTGRKQRQTDEKSGEALQERFGLGVDMVAPTPEDETAAKLVDYGGQYLFTTAVKPLFTEKKLELAGDQMTGSVKKSKRITANVQARKDLLHDRLRGNTRTLVDPFLQEQRQWESTAKRKRVEEQPLETIKQDTKTTSALVNYTSDSE